MKTIYLDSDYKCYTTNVGVDTVLEIQTDIFDNKCDAYIEGYRFVPEGEIWTRDDGFVFTGEMVSPWKPYIELENAQREYEKQRLLAYEYMQEELNTSYQEGINSI